MDWSKYGEWIFILAIVLIGAASKLIRVLLNHQQQMTKIIHEGANQRLAMQELIDLRQEVAGLKTIVERHSGALDAIATTRREPLGAPPDKPLGPA